MLSITQKQCTKCAIVKTLDMFSRDAKGRYGRHSYCRACMNAYNRTRPHVKQNKEYHREYRKRPHIQLRDKQRRQTRHLDPKYRAQMIWTVAKSRSSRHGRNFSVTKEHIEVMIRMGVCERSGIPFNLSSPKGTLINPFSPSIDRKNNREGYTTSNVQIVCNMYNMGKGEHDELDFIAMCVAVAERYADNPAVIARLGELRNAGL